MDQFKKKKHRGSTIELGKITSPPFVCLESFLPNDTQFHLLSPCGNHLHYVMEGKLYKLTRICGGMVQMIKMDLDHTVTKMENYGSWYLIHTEDNKILFINGDQIQVVNGNIRGREGEIQFMGMYEGVFIGEDGIAYHIGPMEVDRFYPVLELATKLDINLTSLKEIKIDRSNGNLWTVTNSMGIQLNKLN